MDIGYCYGEIRYFKSERTYNDNGLYKFNKGKIKAKELVTFDVALMINRREISKQEINSRIDISEQILAIIVRPAIFPDDKLKTLGFKFCGYDLVEQGTGISAITNCGADWGDALDYNLLNQYGLFSDYRQAALAQMDLPELFPDDNHAYCEIIEIWRKINLQEEIKCHAQKQ